MDNKDFDYTLLNILKEEVIKERLRNKFRVRGKVIKKKITRKGSFMFTVQTARSEYGVVVPKHRKMEFKLAKDINEGDSIKVVGDKKIDVVFCDRSQKLGKGIAEGKQMKLLV